MPSECEQSVCGASYPCEPLAAGGYTCRGQFADWSPTYSDSAFRDNGDGTVTDSRSGLFWQRNVPASFEPACGAASSVGSCTWAQAKNYCTGLALAGRSWRLPTAAELESIVDDSQSGTAISPNAFPDTPGSYFWAADLVHGKSSVAWRVDFGSGQSYGGMVSFVQFARCVSSEGGRK